MKKALKITGLLLMGFVLVCGISFLTDKTSYSAWEIKTSGADSLAWAPFEWTSETLNGKLYDRTSMNIPCRVQGIPNPCTFQFDLGAGLSGIYENAYKSYNSNAGQNRFKRLRSPLQFWNRNKYFENLLLQFGDYTAVSKRAFIYRNFGENLQQVKPGDTIHLGTIGADLFRDKILIIDYPAKRFAICHDMPAAYQAPMVAIELDKSGRAILPLTLNNRSFRVLFDNGSSLFPLLVPADKMPLFSTLPDTDTITISSWGKLHDVTGKILPAAFELAGKRIGPAKVYANPSGYGMDPNTDGIAGNALFWNNTLVINFRNHKFGLR